MTPRQPERDDAGTVMLLVLGLVVLLVLLVTVVTDVTHLFLTRKDLLSAADGAALAGAQAVDAERLYRDGITGGPLPLDPVAAERAARDYLSDVGVAAEVAQLSVDIDATATTVTVRLAGTVQLPFVSRLTPGARDGVPVSSSATASTEVVGQ